MEQLTLFAAIYIVVLIAHTAEHVLDEKRAKQKGAHQRWAHIAIILSALSSSSTIDAVEKFTEHHVVEIVTRAMR